MKLFKSQEDLDLTEGGILKPLLFLSLPIVVTNLLQTTYNVADTFWLGQYSTTALAAILFSLGMGVSLAGSVLVAHYIGSNEIQRAEYAASQTTALACLSSLFFELLAYPLVKPTLNLLGASPTVLPAATSYMQIIALGLSFMLGFLYSFH